MCLWVCAASVINTHLCVCIFACVCVCVCVHLCSSKTLSSIEESDVYRMLLKDQEEPQEPRQSGSFKALQDFVDSDGQFSTK